MNLKNLNSKGVSAQKAKCTSSHSNKEEQQNVDQDIQQSSLAYLTLNKCETQCPAFGDQKAALAHLKASQDFLKKHLKKYPKK